MVAVIAFWTFLRALVGGATTRALENAALRHQLAVLRRSDRRPRLTRWDRVFWVWLARLWGGWRSSLVIVRPATVLAWHRQSFRLSWRWRSRATRVGRPPLDPELRDLIRRMAREMFVFVVLRHERRELVQFTVTDHPTATWTARQLVEACPEDTAPRYLLRDRDAVYGREFSRRVERLGIREMRIAPRAPWQNPVVERLIGSIRRECLNHVLILGETHLRRLPCASGTHYNTTRPHQSLHNNSPHPRVIEPPASGRIIAVPEVGGLHHRYQRAA